MRAKGEMQFADIEAVNVTLTLTMPVGAWRNLRAAIDKTSFVQGGSGWQLYHRTLSNLLQQAETKLWADASDEGEQS